MGCDKPGTPTPTRAETKHYYIDISIRVDADENRWVLQSVRMSLTEEQVDTEECQLNEIRTTEPDAQSSSNMLPQDVANALIG